MEKTHLHILLMEQKMLQGANKGTFEEPMLIAKLHGPGQQVHLLCSTPHGTHWDGKLVGHNAPHGQPTGWGGVEAICVHVSKCACVYGCMCVCLCVNVPMAYVYGCMCLCVFCLSEGGEARPTDSGDDKVN